MVVVSVDDLQIFTSPKSSGGARVALAPNGTPILNVDSRVVVGGRDFIPGSSVDFYLMRGAAAIHLGSLDVLGDGTYMGFVPIPGDLARGTFALQVNGVTNNTRQRAASARSISISILVKVIEPAKKVKVVRAIVYFDAFSAKLTKSAKRGLDLIIEQPRTRSDNLVHIVGFVGPGGSISHVKTLSEARANTVARYLRSNGVRGRFVLKSGGRGPGDGPLAWHARVLVIPQQGR
jgi:outer membrane protein OmpA-like peptidoglycan-associated protein